MKPRFKARKGLFLLLLTASMLTLAGSGTAEPMPATGTDLLPVQTNSPDLNAPTVTAVIHDNILHIDVTDELSGVAGVQVNSMLFTSITEKGLDVELDQDINRFEKLAVRAFDYAGNFSEPVMLDNPCYVEPTPMPVAATPEIIATAKPTRKPAEPTAYVTPTTIPAAATPVAVPVVPVTVDSTGAFQHGFGSSLIYVADDAWPTATPVPTAEPTAVPTAVPTAAPTPEPIIQTEYITIGPGMPFQSDGNSHTLDMLYSAATNKQFITLQSKNGNTFYLVIDYDKPIDEKAEMYETYFMNLVDERDLLALMSDEEKEEVPTPTPEIIYVTPAPTNVPKPTPMITPQPAEPVKEEKPNQMIAILTLAAIVAAGGAAAFVLLRNKDKTGRRTADNDFDLDDDDEDDSGVE